MSTLKMMLMYVSSFTRSHMFLYHYAVFMAVLFRFSIQQFDFLFNRSKTFCGGLFHHLLSRSFPTFIFPPMSAAESAVVGVFNSSPTGLWVRISSQASFCCKGGLFTLLTHTSGELRPFILRIKLEQIMPDLVTFTILIPLLFETILRTFVNSC